MECECSVSTVSPAVQVGGELVLLGDRIVPHPMGDPPPAVRGSAKYHEVSAGVPQGASLSVHLETEGKRESPPDNTPMAACLGAVRRDVHARDGGGRCLRRPPEGPNSLQSDHRRIAMVRQKHRVRREEAEDGSRIPREPGRSVRVVHRAQTAHIAGAVLARGTRSTGNAHRYHERAGMRSHSVSGCTGCPSTSPTPGAEHELQG